MFAENCIENHMNDSYFRKPIVDSDAILHSFMKVRMKKRQCSAMLTSVNPINVKLHARNLHLPNMFAINMPNWPNNLIT